MTVRMAGEADQIRLVFERDMVRVCKALDLFQRGVLTAAYLHSRDGLLFEVWENNADLRSKHPM